MQIIFSEALSCWFLYIPFVCFSDPPHRSIFYLLHYLRQEITCFPGGKEPGNAGLLCTRACPTTVSSADSWAALAQLSKAALAITFSHGAKKCTCHYGLLGTPASCCPCCVHALGRRARKRHLRAVGNIPPSCCFSLALAQARLASQQGWVEWPSSVTPGTLSALLPAAA